MSDKENTVVNEIPPEKSNKAKEVLFKIWAGIKEWGRKQIVILKRAPQRIPFVFVLITSILWLFWLFTFSKTVNEIRYINWVGLAIFCNTLLAILIIPLFMNSFPKRKKPNILFIILVFLFMAAMIGLDLVYYININDFLSQQSSLDTYLARFPYISSSLNLAIVHIVLQVICAIMLALIPVYAPLIKKINTAKAIEGNDIKEVIEVDDE